MHCQNSICKLYMALQLVCISAFSSFFLSWMSQPAWHVLPAGAHARQGVPQGSRLSGTCCGTCRTRGSTSIWFLMRPRAGVHSVGPGHHSCFFVCSAFGSYRRWRSGRLSQPTAHINYFFCSTPCQAIGHGCSNAMSCAAPKDLGIWH